MRESTFRYEIRVEAHAQLVEIERMHTARRRILMHSGEVPLHQRLDFGAVNRAAVEAHLEAVVVGRIVAAGDLDAASHGLVVQRPVEHGRRHDADVEQQFVVRRARLRRQPRRR